MTDRRDFWCQVFVQLVLYRNCGECAGIADEAVRQFDQRFRAGAVPLPQRRDLDSTPPEKPPSSRD